MFVLHLDASTPTSWSETGRLSLMGDQGCSLWCDKSFNIIVFANGEASMHVEHSWADAPVMAHAWEWVLCQENLSNCYDAAGNLADTAFQAGNPGSQPASPQLASRVASAASSSAACTSSSCGGKLAPHAQPVRLQWQLTASQSAAVFEAAQSAKSLCADLDLVVDCFDSSVAFALGQTSRMGYGKGFIKKRGYPCLCVCVSACLRVCVCFAGCFLYG